MQRQGGLMEAWQLEQRTVLLIRPRGNYALKKLILHMPHVLLLICLLCHSAGKK